MTDTDIGNLVSELIADAEVRHRENCTAYFDALHRILVICMDYENKPSGTEADALARVIARITRNTLPKRR